MGYVIGIAGFLVAVLALHHFLDRDSRGPSEPEIPTRRYTQQPPQPNRAPPRANDARIIREAHPRGYSQPRPPLRLIQTIEDQRRPARTTERRTVLFDATTSGFYRVPDAGNYSRDWIIRNGVRVTVEPYVRAG